MLCERDYRELTGVLPLSLHARTQLYEAENIREIQESEEESNKPVPRAADEGDERMNAHIRTERWHTLVLLVLTEALLSDSADIAQFFEIEEEERRKDEQTAWNWDDTMRRIEELEAQEEGGDEDEEEEKAAVTPAGDAKAAEFKAQGNSAFAKRRFAEAVKLYSRALEWDPSSPVRPLPSHR